MLGLHYLHANPVESLHIMSRAWCLCLSIILHKICTENIRRDSKRWTQFLTNIFPEVYMLYEGST